MPLPQVQVVRQRRPWQFEGGVAIGKGAFQYSVTVSLTSANILGMFTTPVALLPAPGSGYLLFVNEAMLEMVPTATQYAGGGAVSIIYHGGSAVHASSIPAATINGASASYNILPPLSSVLQAPANTGIDITNATGAFTTGTGTAKVYLNYTVITL